MYPFEWFCRNRQCISQNRLGERTHWLPSRNAVGKHDVWVGQLHTLLDRIQCIHLSGSGEMHSVSVKTDQAKGCTDPQVRVTYGSESDQYIKAGGVVRSSSEILVLLVRDVKMGLGVMELSMTLTWFLCFPMPMRKLSGLILLGHSMGLETRMGTWVWVWWIWVWVGFQVPMPNSYPCHGFDRF